MMNERGKSDSSTVPAKSPNKAEGPAAEVMEGRELTKGNSLERNALRTQSRDRAPSALERVRQAARRTGSSGSPRFCTTCRRRATAGRVSRAQARRGRRRGRRDVAALRREPGSQSPGPRPNGSSGERTGRSQCGGCYIPKADTGGSDRSGVPALEDKVVQRAIVEVLNAIYETDFLGFSYGFRPGRSPHQALDALAVGIDTKKVNWVLDADIRAFFDTLDHGWLVKFIEHRVADQRVVRLIQKWLKAGVLEEGKRIRSEVGTVQGGSISPLLANIYLHYVFDLWVQRWRRKQARGDVIVVRFADDFVAGL